MSHHALFGFFLLLLLFAATSIAAYICFSEGDYVNGGIMIAVAGMWIYLIFRRLESVNWKLAYFFEALQNNDFSVRLMENEGLASERLLNSILNRIRKMLQDIRSEIQQQEKYYELILANIDTGVVALDARGFVLQVNRFALKLLGMEVFTHIEQLKKISFRFYEAVHDIRCGENRQIVYSTERGNVQLLVHATRISLQGREVKLLVMNDIENEMDEKEIDSWIRLIRVLSHEIMNSIAPITSLSDTLLSHYESLVDTDPGLLRQDTVNGLQVIRNTGKSLISFVESYRKFTRIPEPIKEQMDLNEFFHRMIILCSGEPCFERVHIQTIIQPENLTMYADPNLLGQVVLNLMKNAIQAMQGQPDPRLWIEAFNDQREHVVLRIRDNGPGIPPEILNEIFVPFFTTKENGSGIGLSVSRQIMRMHGGNIKVSSVPNKETVFTITI